MLILDLSDVVSNQSWHDLSLGPKQTKQPHKKKKEKKVDANHQWYWFCLDFWINEEERWVYLISSLWSKASKQWWGMSIEILIMYHIPWCNPYKMNHT